jgi:hypothetical protein
MYRRSSTAKQLTTVASPLSVTWNGRCVPHVFSVLR